MQYIFVFESFVFLVLYFVLPPRGGRYYFLLYVFADAILRPYMVVIFFLFFFLAPYWGDFFPRERKIFFS